jgi:hypothetical protein
MKKEMNVLDDNKSYVYPATEENLLRFKEDEHKLMSKDKNYILIYSEKHLEEIYDYFDWLYEQDQLLKCSMKDLAYEDLLVEANIKTEFDPKKYSSMLTKANTNNELVIRFDDPKHNILKDILCDAQDLKNGRSIGLFVQVAASVNDFGKKIEDVIPSGYFKYQRNEVK